MRVVLSDDDTPYVFFDDKAAHYEALFLRKESDGSHKAAGFEG